ncbi:MAG: SDR family oxidoreductase [Nocardioidaceae bacterium]
MTNPVLVVVGAGPGLGAAIAHRFGHSGYDVALIARSAERLDSLGAQLQAAGITTGWTPVDIIDVTAFAAAVERFGQHAGRIDVLHFNPSAFTGKGPLELTSAELLADVGLGVASLLTAVQAARPFMSAGARITATGGATADRPWPSAASLGVQKAGLRNLVAAVDAELSDDGIRAMSLTVAGTIAPETPFDPRHIADAFYAACQTADADWRSEVRFTGHD